MLRLVFSIIICAVLCVPAILIADSDSRSLVSKPARVLSATSPPVLGPTNMVTADGPARRAGAQPHPSAQACAPGTPGSRPPAQVLKPVSVTIRGRVLDPSGRPTAGAPVMLRSAAGVTRESRTDDAGAFAFTGVQPGRYDVLSPADGFRSDPAAVVAGKGEVVEVDVRLRLSGVTETVVVSAGFVDTPLSEAPGSVTTMTRGDLRARQMTTVAQALALVPGTAVAPTGGAGSVTSMFPRGGESDYTLVLLDGMRLNSFGGGYDFGHATTFGLDQIEVVRGAQSAIFGADAIGSVIQFRTKIGGPAAGAADIETGGHGTTRVAVGSTGSRASFKWGAHLERLASDGWTDAAPGTTERVVNDDYRSTQLAVAGEWKASPRSTVRADARFGSNERGNPGPFGSNPIGAFTGIDRVSRGRNDDGMGSVAFTHEWNSTTALRVQSTYADLRSGFVSPYGDSLARTRRLTGRVQVDHAVSPAVATSFGLDLDAERADSTYVQGESGQRVPVRRHVIGYFGEARFRQGSRLVLTTGLRVEQIDRLPLEADPLAFAPRPALPADRVLSANPRVAASYYVRTSDQAGGNWSRIHASAGTGIRPPDALEIAFTDNPGLRPERSRSVDAGFEQALAGGLLVMDATWFTNHYDDLIVAVGRSLQDYSRYRTDNISNARARGLETSAALRLRGGFEARATYTYLDTAVLAVDRSPGLAPPPFHVGDPLLRRPRHQAALDVLWRRPSMTAFARVGGRSGVLDVEPSWGASGGLFRTQGFAVADAGVSFRLARQIELVARVDNLFNRQYESVLGYPAPRRVATVGVRLATGR